MRALVTGGAGFIGSHLVERLVGLGHDVVVLDDLSTGRRENLAGLAGSGRLETCWGSVLDDERLPELVASAEIVYHLAAAVGVRLILERPVETIETNVLGTDRVLRAAAKSRTKVVLASTSEVYGKNDALPLREDDDGVLGPTAKGRWSYACAKMLDEFLGLAHLRSHGTPVVIVRYFNTVGPRQTGRYGMVVPRFVRQALTNAPITVYGDGGQSRSFTDVEDAVRATVGLSLYPGAVGEVFNIGNGRETTIEALAVRVRELVGSRSEIVHVPYTEAYEAGFEDIRRRVPDIGKLRQAIGFEPAVDLDACLAGIIAYHRGGGEGAA